MLQKESKYISDTLKDMISHGPEVVSLQNKIETSEIILPHISKNAKKIKEIAENPDNHITKKDIEAAEEKSE